MPEKVSWITCSVGHKCSKGNECYRWRISDEDCIHDGVSSRLNFTYVCMNQNYLLFTPIDGRPVREISEEIEEGEDDICVMNTNPDEMLKKE